MNASLTGECLTKYRRGFSPARYLTTTVCSESQAEAKFTQCGFHAGKKVKSSWYGLSKHAAFISAPSAPTLFKNGAVFIQENVSWACLR